MYIVPIAWLYVALMMAVAEATSSQGTLLGAFFTFVFYGLAPIGLVLYFMGTPARRRQRLAREAEETQAYLAAQQTAAAPPALQAAATAPAQTKASELEMPPSPDAQAAHGIPPTQPTAQNGSASH